MKIKLVTFAPHPNFGTCLQSYALNKVLRDMGHDVEFIYNGRENQPKTLAFYIKAVIKWFLPHNLIQKVQQKKRAERDNNLDYPPFILTLPDNPLHYRVSRMPGYVIVYKWLMCRTLQWKKVWKFTFEDGNYKMKRLYCKKQYAKVVNDADIFITGSDQIWNPYCGGYNPLMFLEFAGDKKRVAYSSSIARTKFPSSVENRAKDALSKFQYIAVREKSSVDMLNKLLGRNDVQLVVDPTYLLSKEQWTEFGNRASVEFELPKNYIFCYFVGDRYEDYEKMVCDVKAQTGINNVITLECYNRPQNYGGGLLYNDAGPYEWVYLLAHSSYICMDSFHATVFALKFHKEFVHILKTKSNSSSESQNSRMYDLLSRYDLEYKLYEEGSNDWLRKIDYTKVDDILEKEIKESMDYLSMEVS